MPDVENSLIAKLTKLVNEAIESEEYSYIDILGSLEAARAFVAETMVAGFYLEQEAKGEVTSNG